MLDNVYKALHSELGPTNIKCYYTLTEVYSCMRTYTFLYHSGEPSA